MKTSAIFRIVPLVIILSLLSAGCNEPPEATPTATVGATATAQPKASPTSTPNLVGTPTISTAPSIVDVAEKVRPAVVSIIFEQVVLDWFFRPIPQEGVGSGVIFDDRGYILTNNHVVEDARSLTITLPDGRTFDGTLVGRDSVSDLAIVKIEADDLPAVPLGDSEKLRIGEWVIAIGNPLGLEGGPTVTVGVVGATGRSITDDEGNTLEDMIQTDAAINPGNSGGPLVSLAGEVVGINTAIIAETEGLGFAVSIATARPVIESILMHGRVIRPYLGVSVLTVTPSIAEQYELPVDEGALIVEIVRGSPAAEAGLLPGDIIIRFGETEIATNRQLTEAISQHKVGGSVQVTFLRDEEERTISVTLAERPEGF